MAKPELILIGAGGHAHACIDVIEQHGKYEIAGLVGLPEEMNSRHLGYSVIAIDNDLQDLAKEYQYAIITIGQIQTVDARIRLYNKAVEIGLQLPIIVSPSSNVSKHAVLGAGTIVMHGAIVNAGSSIGVNCIINTHSLIEHDARVGDHCHISTGTILNGSVVIGDECFVGSGSLIKEGISLGRNCVVGMGVSVRHKLTDNSRFVG